MIDLTQLTFKYKKSKNIFTNINLSLKEEGIYGLLGKNGSGKTSLLKLISGLAFPNSGNCNVLDYQPKNRHPSFLNSIYFLPDEIFTPKLTPEKYSQFYSAFYPNFDHKLFFQYLLEFDLSPNKLLTELSHGQKKKAMLAFGLATNTKILLLDEPTNGLDIPSKAQFKKLLASIASKNRLIIIATHQVHDIKNLIDTVLVLDEGEIIFHENIKKIDQRLSFVHQYNDSELSQSIYYEKVASGYLTVVPYDNHQPSEIDLELLFNALLTNKEKIQPLFAAGDQ